MKKLIMFTVIFASVFMITACGNDDENSKQNSDQQQSDMESQPVMNQTDMGDKMNQLDYTVYDFDVLYDGTEFEGEIANEEGLIEAEFYNPFVDVTARGSDAFKEMFPVLQELELNPDMTDEEAVAESIAAFDLPEDFLKAELQVTFSDGVEKTYEVKQ
ncbi:YusW family protein [Virgibacillus doumboii]|uniref:YusW family protein n=1 Tax=Virgibacillus doumboii TaxID=2697503 RepID=UPI0013DFC276|nr:YusW family protein [Virgibacillus doumboii]